MRGLCRRPGGADWLLTLPDGTGLPDTRYNLKTHDGAYIYIQTKGTRVGPKEVLERLVSDTTIGPDEYRLVVFAILNSSRAMDGGGDDELIGVSGMAMERIGCA